ncbi:peptide/nickel transport system permease protein [Planomicrobium koreense]|uniref:Peptide/nickel transport system permease protein n=1 Tax=Planococcus koreensis TaxID=112331 RepID=A0A7W8CSG4_9BACL|nr:ABC transporter permease subunit [Planococcus koreensis]MBB5179524.1 peptide/nickel transport system permease protein [Planococcus koreensis]
MKLMIKFVFSVLGIVLVSGFPVLIGGLVAGELRLTEYIGALEAVLRGLWPLQEFTVLNMRTNREIPLFPTIGEYIIYSLELLFLAFAVAIFFAITFTVLTMLLKEKARQRIKMALYFLESLPDLLVIMLAQLAVIAIYLQTNVLISKIAVVQGDHIYWLPVLCLALLPMIQLYRLCMLTFRDEERKMYIELARSLGFSKVFVIWVHMFRNAIISVFFQSKKTIWFMLSNLFVLELMFNIPGIMLFMKDNISPEVFLVSIFSFFLPIFLLYSIGEWLVLRHLRGKEAI